MIIAELKALYSPDVDDLRNYKPEDAACFCVLLQAMYGPMGSDGQESFDIIACTPLWMLLMIRKNGPVLGYHHLLLEHYNYDLICDYLRNVGARCRGETWSEVAAQLSKVGHWEFDGYSEGFVTSG